MKLADFDFPLPAAAIAQRPIVPRDAARMLEVSGRITDGTVRDLPALLGPGDVMVYNDTRVIPARLMGRRGEIVIEITLLKPLDARRWRALAKKARRLRPGQRIDFAPGLAAIVEAKGEGGEVTVAFEPTAQPLIETLEAHGVAPLPPYIKRAGLPDERDRRDYQTVYATRPGAIAAPTAGLHFTERLLEALDARGIRRVMLTLHVGAGTFRPMTTEKLEDHVMHPEWGEIGAEAAEAINLAKERGRKVVAVGTTTLRLLETAADENGRVAPFGGDTNVFITPGRPIRSADLLLTNFHLPRSTLFMLVCAFAGIETMKRAYAHALAGGYRFYSYGDCCLLHRTPQP